MSEVRLVVCDAECDWSGTVHGSWADRAVAALSADPVTRAELEAAMDRFAKPRPQWRQLGNLERSRNEEPYDAGIVVIDLIARMVVVNSTYSAPQPVDSVEYHNGQCRTETALRYHVAEDWIFSDDIETWRNFAEQRRRQRAETPVVDARAVFFGRPLLEYVAREVFGAFQRREEIAAPVRARWEEEKKAGRTVYEEKNPFGPFQETISQIHASWLLTPRADLGGVCPREVALERRDHITWDLQDRSEQWSQLHECPRGLDETSHAFRYGGFGTHELVMYYDFVRELLWSCWSHLTDLSESPTRAQNLESMTVNDFLAAEIPRLEKVGEAWLDAPDPEYHGRTPRSIITKERARLPEGTTGREAVIDNDCPCCQMMADMKGPVFWGLDGSSMEDDFAFDIYRRTREEWDAEQRKWEEFNKRFNAKQEERERLGVTDSQRHEDGSSGIWSRSFFVDDSPDVPLGIRIFGVGCNLAELIVDLRAGSSGENTLPQSQHFIDSLNRDFGNLREVLQNADSTEAGALIEPVRDRFVETLANLGEKRSELAEKCEALTGKLQRLLNPPQADSDENDEDVPF